MRATPISEEDYLRKKMSKFKRLLVGDKLNELIDHFALLHQHKHLNDLEKEGEERMPKNTASKAHKTSHLGEIEQIGNRQ